MVPDGVMGKASFSLDHRTRMLYYALNIDPGRRRVV